MRPFYAAIAILSFVAAVLIDFFYFPHSTIFPDEKRFFSEATNLLSEGSFFVGNDVAWEMPGTAIFQSVIIYLFPAWPIFGIRIAQASLVAIQAVLIGHIANRIFGIFAAIIATVVAGFYPFFLYYQGLLLSETLFTFFLVAAVASLIEWRHRKLGFNKYFFLGIVLLVAATYVKATLTFLPPIIIAVMAAERSWFSALKFGIISALLFVALMSPWWVRNQVKLSAFVPFSTSAAMNFYLGNSPNNPDAGADWSVEFGKEPYATISVEPGELARSKLFSKAAIDFIISHPMKFFDRMRLKLIRFWNVIPNAPSIRGTILSTITFISFTPIFLASLLAAFRIWDFPPLRPIYLIITYFTFVHVVTIASLRYRLPIEPFLIIIASGLLGWHRKRKAQAA